MAGREPKKLTREQKERLKDPKFRIAAQVLQSLRKAKKVR